MAHVLALSSWVAHGHVGLSAAAPVLQALGHRVTQLPTVQLSNHAGWPHVAGQRVDLDTLSDIVDALDRNGWLGDVDAILTGYLPSAEHVRFAARLIDRVRGIAQGVRIVVDPVLGDAPKGLYIAREAAQALHNDLLPQADVLTPNLFELSWLTGRAVETLNETRASAQSLRDLCDADAVFVTSAPLDTRQIGILSVDQNITQLFRVKEEPEVPNGVGDVFSALIAGGVGAGAALGMLQMLIHHSAGAPHLKIAETAATWTTAKPITANVPTPLTDAGETR